MDLGIKKYFLILAIVFITALLILYFHLTQHNNDNTYSMDGSKHIKYYEKTIKKFESDQFILLTLNSENIFAPRQLEPIRTVTNYLNSLLYINYDSSVSNLKLPVYSKSLSLYQVILETENLSTRQAKDIKKLILKTALNSSRFIPKKKKVTDIYIIQNKIDSSKETFLNEFTSTVKELTKNKLSPKYSGPPILETTIDKMMIRNNKIFIPIAVNNTTPFLTWGQTRQNRKDTKSALFIVSEDTGKAIVVTPLILSAGVA